MSHALLQPMTAQVDRSDLWQIADQIKNEVRQAEGHLRDSIRHALLAGEYLLIAKSLVEHGEWAKWFQSNQFDFGERTAQRYMRFYRKWNETLIALGANADPEALANLSVANVLHIHAKQVASTSVGPVECVEECKGLADANQSAKKVEAIARPVALNPTAQVEKGSNSTHHTELSPDEWLTPQDIKEAAELVLGQIELDPAADRSLSVPATRHFTKVENGLDARLDWEGRVFLNPPVCKSLVARFCQRLLLEFQSGHVEEAILLVPARTNQEWFRTFRHFIRVFISKPQFGTVPSMSEPLVAIYLGDRICRFYEVFDDLGDCYTPYCGRSTRRAAHRTRFLNGQVAENEMLNH